MKRRKGTILPSEMLMENLKCHAFKHWWDFKTDFGVTTGADQTLIEMRTLLVCERCGTESIVTRDAWLDIVKRRYRYPEGYLMQPDGEGPQEHHTRRALSELAARQGVLAR